MRSAQSSSRAPCSLEKLAKLKQRHAARALKGSGSESGCRSPEVN